MSNRSAPVLPVGVGPHAERELLLMLAGSKPAAMFSEAVQHRSIMPEADFAPYVADGRLVKREYLTGDPQTGIEFIHIYYALPGEEWRIDALHKLEVGIQQRTIVATPEIETEIGRLLGYTEDEIAAYLIWTRIRKQSAE